LRAKRLFSAILKKEKAMHGVLADTLRISLIATARTKKQALHPWLLSPPKHNQFGCAFASKLKTRPIVMGLTSIVNVTFVKL
jgi:hypothetical protein